MALDVLEGIADTLRLLAEWPAAEDGQGPARKRVGRFSFRAFLAIVALTAIGLLVVWLRSPSFEAFDQAGLPVATLGVFATLVLLAVHLFAAIVANRIDRRRASRP